MSEQNMTSEIVSLRNENAVLRDELALANQQLEWFRKQIFGRKTEQTSVVMVIISLPGKHQSATRKTLIRIKERTDLKRGTHQSA
ncbi:hypothetical protein [Ruminococcus albus]|uniref:Putative transposase n=1 Tax=Ruminococcus albus (strain ATCC 27210 / DSM 20455 / JCM 14654 / NCDO 2250 / 7) TaxID=697329 RepID=E6UF05_RUMA7|nr:hypothetical protein [Ruminococcus albus]ADU23004.1 putative transposase [Ruminococcus albus 7 = DSM 20455]